MSMTPSHHADERLTRALRITASQAAGLIGGGASLVYTHTEGDARSGRLRAAAGFASADEARATSTAIESFVRAIADSAEPHTAPVVSPLAERMADATMYGLPLVAREGCVGALVVVPTAELPPETSANLEALAWGAAAQVDHPALAHRYASLSAESEKHLETADEKSGPVLSVVSGVRMSSPSHRGACSKATCSTF